MTIKPYFEIIFTHSLIIKLKSYFFFILTFFSNFSFQAAVWRGRRERSVGSGSQEASQSINQSFYQEEINQRKKNSIKWMNWFASRNSNHWYDNFLHLIFYPKVWTISLQDQKINWLIDWFFEEEILSNGFEKLSLPGPGIIYSYIYILCFYLKKTFCFD